MHDGQECQLVVMAINNEGVKRLIYLHSHVKVIKCYVLALDALLLLLLSLLARRSLTIILISSSIGLLLWSLCLRLRLLLGRLALMLKVH